MSSLLKRLFEKQDKNTVEDHIHGPIFTEEEFEFFTSLGLGDILIDS